MPFFTPPPGQPTVDPTLSTPPTSQGLYTTYASRLRTGVSTLIQPEHATGTSRDREALLADAEREGALPPAHAQSGASTPRVDSPAPLPRARGAAAAASFSGRRGGRVNYAEKEESDESSEESSDDDAVEAASDPEDADYGAKGQSQGRRGAGAGRSAREADMAAAKERARKRRREEEEGVWTWLGDIAPGDRVRSARAKQTRHLPISEELLEREKDRPELLVPITVDIDVPSADGEQPGIKVCDRFLWNANEPFLKPADFARTFCDDIGIPPDPHATTIADLIVAQVEEAMNTVEVDVVDADVGPDDVRWSEDDDDDEDDEREWAESDCRVIVNLDVQIASTILRDRIEWDLSSRLPVAEFAAHYAAELGLAGEAVPLVACAIADELVRHKRDALDLDLFAATHPLEQAKYDKGAPPKTTSRSGARRLTAVWRDWWEREEFGPVLIEVGIDELERREMERTREARRMMRNVANKRRR
ncbi:Chromatin structure remodeling complex protein sfh1 [Cryptotrichosporon argae]